MDSMDIKHKITYLKNEYELCVSCGEKTYVKKRAPVAIRKHYIDGVGQLCPKCYADLQADIKKYK